MGENPCSPFLFFGASFEYIGFGYSSLWLDSKHPSAACPALHLWEPLHLSRPQGGARGTGSGWHGCLATC